MHQGDERTALGLAEARLAAAAGPHPQPVQAALVEGMQPFPHGVRMTVERERNRARPLTIPAAHDQLGMENPVGGGMHTGHEFAHLALFPRIERWTRTQ